METRSILLAAKLKLMTDRWNALIEKINKLGGSEFINNPPLRLTDAELRDMIALCHPDKHNGSKRAEEITKKLNIMRQ